MKEMVETTIKQYLSGEIKYREAINRLYPIAKECTDRLWALFQLGYGYAEYTEKVNSWLTQWEEKPAYNVYNINDVNLLVIDNMLYLIPKENNKPIKVIKA